MQSRGLNSIRNAASGVLKTAVKILFPFLLRTILLYYLGEEYLGLNSLFYSILVVLNLAELGFSSAVAFRIYKPLADEDAEKVGAYLNYLRSAYRLIGTLILAAGLLIMPFLPRLINAGWPDDINIYWLFLIYIINSSISYFFAGYKGVLVIASQRMDYINMIEMSMYCLQYIVQLAVVMISRNYYAYILVMPLFTILVNCVTAYLTDRKYAKYLNREKLPVYERKAMLGDIWGVAICKVSEVTRNSFDSIIISALLGLVPVAVYNNYYYILTAVLSFMIILNQSLQSGVGNSIATETREKNEHDLYKLSFFSAWLNVVCSTSILCMSQNFISIWVGQRMLLTDFDMMLFAVYFYILNMCSIRNLYFDGNGLWMQGKYAFIAESLGNLFLNIILCRRFGITGILAATIITVFLCGFVWRSRILFREYFRKSATPFFRFHLAWGIRACVIAGLTWSVCRLAGSYGFSGLIMRLFICIVMPNGILFLLYRKRPEFREGVEQLKAIVLKRKQ